jgi:pantoate--beta-alanine ligase
MKLVESIEEMQKIATDERARGRSLALVPTMGYLHAGHASLMEAGRKQADLLVASIFVNPTQFGVGEDFEKYPRDMERDSKIAAAAGVDILFAPTAVQMYPAGYQTYVAVEELTKNLCGASRPGHFRGVTTVVSKLFGIVQPNVALFGRKDFQQLAIIRRMTADLNMPVRIVGMPIVREADGLAMSSRNAYLTAAERKGALVLNRSLEMVRTSYDNGMRSVTELRKCVVAMIQNEPLASIDYVEFCTADSLEKTELAADNTLLALAVKFGNTRLIDNCVLGEE